MHQEEKIKHIRNITLRCQAMCGSEAVALDLPFEAGEEMHDAIINDDLEGWRDDEFMLWVDKLIEKYGTDNEKRLLTLYDTCHVLMHQYGNLMETTTHD